MSPIQIINDSFDPPYIEQPKAKEIKTDKDVQTASLSEKLGYVLKRAAGQFLPEVGAKLLELASPQSLALIATGVGLLAVSQSSPVGWIADAAAVGTIALTGLGLWAIGKDAMAAFSELKNFATKTINAKSIADLDAAGDSLAKAGAIVGVDTLVGVLTHQAAKRTTKYYQNVEGTGKLIGEYGISPKVIESLGKKGLSLRELEADLGSLPKAKYPNVKDLGRVANILNDLAKFDLPLKGEGGMKDAVLAAAQEPKALATMERAIQLANQLKATGRITNPTEIGAQLSEGIQGIKGQIQAANNPKPTPHHPDFSNGRIYELEVALRELKNNPNLKLQLGYKEIWTNKKLPDGRTVKEKLRKVGGDLVDNQHKIVTQLKEVLGIKETDFTGNVEAGINQLNGLGANGKGGKNAEIVPEGYRKNLDIKLPSNSAVGKLSVEGVIQAIKKKDIKNFDGTIRIECGDRVLNLKVNIDGAKKDIKVLNNQGWSQESSSIQGESNSSVTASTTGLQATPSMGETAEVAQANNAKLQEILARMQTRDPSNNIPTNGAGSTANPTTEAANNTQPTPTGAANVTNPANTNPASTGTQEASTNQTSAPTTQPATTSQNGSTPSSTAFTNIQNGSTPSSTAFTNQSNFTPSALTGGSTALTGTVAGRSSTALTGGTSSTALTGGTSNTALTGGTSSTALTGGATALTGGKTQEPSQQQGLALS
jgi:hypothetical protein